MALAEECTILWIQIWCHSSVSLFCYNALFSKIGFRFRHISLSICTNKNSHWVCTSMWTQRHCIPFLGTSLWSWQSMGRISIYMYMYNEERQKHFSLPMLISFIDCKLNKRCPRLGMQCLCVHTLVQTQCLFLFVHMKKCA